MDKLEQLPEVPSGARDSSLDTTSLPSETFATANESSSKYFSLSEVDSTFDISSIKDDSLASTAPASDTTITNTEDLISNLSPINKETYKIGKQIEAANILSGGVNIFDDNDNSYDGDELVIDDNIDEEKTNTDLKSSECLPESALINEAVDIGSRDSEVLLHIDGKNLNAIDIGNGLYLYRREGEEELAAIQISDDDQDQPSFKFLKVRENEEGSLVVYEEIKVEVPKKVPNREGKTVNKTTSSHMPIKDINKVMDETTLTEVSEGKLPNKEATATSIVAEHNDTKSSSSENKSELNLNGKMMKYNESRKSPVISSFTPMTYHSTPNKEGKPLTKTMVDLQLHPSRHSDNVKKTIEVHTDNLKPKQLELPHKIKEDIQTTEIFTVDENKMVDTPVCAKQFENLDNLKVTGPDKCLQEDYDIDSDAKILQDVTEIMKEQDIQILPDAPSDNETVPSASIDNISSNITITNLSSNKVENVLIESVDVSEVDDTNKQILALNDVSNDQKLESNSVEHESQIVNIHVEDVKEKPENNVNATDTVAPRESNSGATELLDKELTKMPLVGNVEENTDEIKLIDESKTSPNTQLKTVCPDSSDKSDEKINHDNLKDSKEKETILDEPTSPCVENIGKDVNQSEKVMPDKVIKENTISENHVIDTLKSREIRDIETTDSKSLENTSEPVLSVHKASEHRPLKEIPIIEEKVEETFVEPDILKTSHVQSDKPVTISSELKDMSKEILSKLQDVTRDTDLVAHTTIKPESLAQLPEKGMISKELQNNKELHHLEIEKSDIMAPNMSNTQVAHVEEQKAANKAEFGHSRYIDNAEIKQQIMKPAVTKTISGQELNIPTIPKPSDKKEISKISTDVKPINNNHAAVPFGKWTEANRQEFLNKFKSKVPTSSTNTNQIKNSNDLNRRDVLKKIDSQRQSSNALAKAQDINKQSMKNETAFGKTNLLSQESKIPLKSEVLELKVIPTTDKTSLKSDPKETIVNKPPILPLKNVITGNLDKNDFKACAKSEVVLKEPLPTKNVVSNIMSKKETKQKTDINTLNPVKNIISEVSKKEPKNKPEIIRQGTIAPKSTANDNKSKTESKRRTDVKSSGPLPLKKIINESVAKTETKQTDIKHSSHAASVPLKVPIPDNGSKKEQSQRTEVNYQDLIDKTIEDMLHRGIPTKSCQDESKQNPDKESSSSTNKGSYKQNYPSMDEFATLDAIEMKMNELHGIPFIERPPHELPKVLKTDTKNQSKSDKDKPASTKSNKEPQAVLPLTNKIVQNTVNDKPSPSVDSEDEIIEHEPVTGDIELNKKNITTKPSGNVKINSNADKHTSDSSKQDPIITEKDFDKFARRNSMTYENRITVNFETKEPHNIVQTAVPKDSVPKNVSKSGVIILDSKTLPSYHKPQNDSVSPVNRNSINNFGNEDPGNRNQSKVQKAYQSALTAKRQLECPITIIEDKPVKVVYMDTMEFAPSHLDVQGQDLSPAKKLTSESDLIFTGDSVDSDILDSMSDIKSQEETKVKTKHQRKQVLTPVAEPELELIEPRDLGIHSPNKKKRKTEEDKNVKHMMRKKMYLLSSVDENQHNSKEVKKPLSETANLNDPILPHQTHVSAIDNLVKAAELIENQSENGINVAVSTPQAQLNTPVKRGRGRPRKYPLPDGATEVKNKEPSPQKKPRLIDAKPVKQDSETDEEDADSNEGIVRENWTMGKINENIVCPICNKLFRTENVVFKHVKHCTGPSPSRSGSDKRSPRRLRESQESDETLESKSDYIEDEDDKPLLRREDTETPKKHKPKNSIHKLDVDKDEVILIEDTPDKQKPEKIDERKQHESRKQKSKLPCKNNELVCEFCGKTFRQLSYLVNHKLQHKKEEPKKEEAPIVNKSVHTCEVCKKAFRKLHHLVQHRIIHKPTSLPVRSLRKSSSEQSEHKSEKSHASSKQSEDASAGFRCEPCDKSFRKLHHLVEHRETHDGINRQKNTSIIQNITEKPVIPHVCDICKKTFKKLQHLLEHKEQHLDTCSEKSDDKSIKSSLSTKDIIHECALCYMVFPNEHSLNKHTVICQRKKSKSKQKHEEDPETTEETAEEMKIDEIVEDNPKTLNENTEKPLNVLDNKNESFSKDKLTVQKDKHEDIIQNKEVDLKTECQITKDTKESIKSGKRQNTVTPIKRDKPETSADSDEISVPEKIKKINEISEKNNKIVELTESLNKADVEKSRKEEDAVKKTKRTKEVTPSAKKEIEVLDNSKKSTEATEKLKKESVTSEKTKKSVLPEKVKKETAEKLKKDITPELLKKDDIPLKSPNKNREVPETVKQNPEATEKVKPSKDTKNVDTIKKKTPLKDKLISKTKRPQTTAPTLTVGEPKPAVESSDDDEVRYMLNPDFKVEETEEKVFMRIKAQKRNSFQIERPNSKDLMKRRISLQHPPKIPRLKPKQNDNVPIKNLVKSTKVESAPSTDSDDSDVKYSFPETVPEKPVKAVQENIVKEVERRTPRKLNEKRKTLSGIAKRKSVGKAVIARHKPSPLKHIKRRTLEVEHRCDCGQLFSSAALLTRHTSLAHTPPRIRRRRSPLPESTQVTKPVRKSEPQPSTTSRKSSVRSDTSSSKPKTEVRTSRRSTDKALTEKKASKPDEAKSGVKVKRTGAHRGVPVPEKMKKMMQKNK